eukprot:GHVO01053370.1.p1 GENE.GHVO01053370.1~~GHVO01053370.1.p1  ORF type:complete len:105 (-),score=4.06 GHVO01053370.1:75-389(-)
MLESSPSSWYARLCLDSLTHAHMPRPIYAKAAKMQDTPAGFFLSFGSSNDMDPLNSMAPQRTSIIALVDDAINRAIWPLILSVFLGRFNSSIYQHAELPESNAQ